MIDLLKVLEKKYYSLINDYQLLKEILYRVSNAEIAEKIQKFMDCEKETVINSILNPKNQPTSATDALTFIGNLIKDTKDAAK